MMDSQEDLVNLNQILNCKDESYIVGQEGKAVTNKIIKIKLH
jgi:hypothetical protein